MHLSCCGINHHTSTLCDRESFHITREEIGRAVEQYRKITNASEAVIIATCNRIEFYRIDIEKVSDLDHLDTFYRNRGVQKLDRLKSITFARQGTSAARHLFKVAAGLDSVLLGEYQVLSQVKSSYSTACVVNGPGKYLHKLFHFAFQIAKRIRSETEISEGVQSLAGAAVEILREKCGIELTNRNILLIGVNRSTEMLLSRLVNANHKITILNRTLYNAEKIAKSFGVDAAPLDVLSDYLPKADLLFSATSSRDYVVQRQHFDGKDENHRLYAVDLAIPRDIDPSIATLPGVTLFDLDDLKRLLDNVQTERMIDLPYALDLIEEQVSAYKSWRGFSNGDHSADIRKLIDEDRRQIMERFRDNFRQGEVKALEAFSHSLCRAFLRRITSNQPLPEKDAADSQ